MNEKNGEMEFFLEIMMFVMKAMEKSLDGKNSKDYCKGYTEGWMDALKYKNECKKQQGKA